MKKLNNYRPSKLATQSKEKHDWKQEQLNKTLTKTKTTLESLIKKNVPPYENFSKLARDVALIVGVDPSLYRKTGTPQKKLFDSFAVKLCTKIPRSVAEALIPEETLQIQLSEARHRIHVLENILADLTTRSKPKPTLIKTDSFLHAFETTCQLIEIILKEEQYLYFEKGRLMTRATMTGVSAPLSDAKTCKPFLDWRHAKNTNPGSLSTAELEESLRSSIERGTSETD
ncbi:hypothetical protein ACIPFI_19450 [Pseudomonas sp. NPDC087039]|uniref:hypothetical protein n=1 Tax=Pseudomonas sp. NPDC087039 TaxID=3364434 RepID=UPI00382D59DC